MSRGGIHLERDRCESTVETLFAEASKLLQEQFTPTPFRRLAACARGILHDGDAARDVVQNICAERWAWLCELRDAENVEVLQQTVDAWRTAPGRHRAYLVECVKHEAVDGVRAKGRFVSNGDIERTEAVLLSSGRSGFSRWSVDPQEYQLGDPSEIVTGREKSASLTDSIGAINLALYERNTSRPGSVLSLDIRQLHLLSLFYRFDPLLDPQPTDEELDKREERDRTDELFRRRKKDNYERDVNWGMNERVAQELGKNKSTVSRAMKTVNSVVALAVYLTAVLGRFNGLSSTATVNEHLDQFDLWHANPERHPEVKMFRLASGAVHTRPDVGTRVDPTRFLALHAAATRKAAKAADSDLEPQQIHEALCGEEGVLHLAETDYAIEVESRHPRCVAVCTPHNPEDYRVLEP